MKTIGILGGMGPYATVDFLRLILDLTAANSENQHLHTITNSNPSMPSRTRAFLLGESDPVPMLRSGIKSLVAAGADFVVTPCNSAHHFLPRALEGLPIPCLDMVAETAKRISKTGHRCVGLLAGEVTVQAQLYDKALARYDVRVTHVDESQQIRVREVIEDVKLGAISETTIKKLRTLVGSLSSQGAEAVVLGCTELQAVSIPTETVPLIDSLFCLAQSAILFAGGQIRQG